VKRLLLVFVTVGACVVWAAPSSLRAQQRPVFRSTTLGVAVDVSVKKGNTPVANLTAADFELTDNGVPQTIDSAQIETVPVDVTLAVDVSGSTRGLLGRYRSDVGAIAKLLRPVDRLRLIAFGTRVDEALRLGSVVGRVPVDRLEASSNSAVYDGIAAALLRPAAGIDRRHLIVAFTDSYDNRSVVSPELLGAAARRSESVLHIVSREPPSMGASEVLYNGLYWAPVALDEVAEATGGERHTPAGWITQPGGTLVVDFEKIFSDFRQSYVLRFTPNGVPPEGWHDLSVSLKLKGNYRIRARRGYFGS
jgi:VWFA-related protein